jgi:hypothetical protein
MEGRGMTRWVRARDWQRAKGSVSQQLKDKASPRVRVGRTIVKRGAGLAVRAGKAKRWTGNGRGKS